jgi:cyclopropane-fatty-acyl-phospholipid synthase
MQLGDRELSERKFAEASGLSELVGMAEGQLGGDSLRFCGSGLAVDSQRAGHRGPMDLRPVASGERGTERSAECRPATWFERRCRSLLFRKLRSLPAGWLTVDDFDGSWQLGAGQAWSDGVWTGPPVKLEVNDPAAYRRIVTGGDLGFAEALIAGEIHCDRLVALLRFLILHAEAHRDRLGQPSAGRRWWSGIRHWLRRNHRTNARKNIQAHYDLSNDFFSLWLDPTLSYSSGIFPSLQPTVGPSGREWRSEATMEVASVQKLERICQKLELRPDDHLLEIGCGWGGLAIHAARRYGCRVTGITLSPAQLQVAQERVAEAGLADRVSLQLVDYRDVSGQFDKLVSVEMIEAVGQHYWDQYFGACCRLLKPSGRMVLQGITIGDQRHGQYLKRVDFIREYIFPGGCLISTSAVLRSLSRVTDFRLTHLEDIGQHYAETLRRWRESFCQAWPQIERLGFDRRFFRMWNYYLAYCEAGFAEGHVGTVQVVLDRQRHTAPVPLPGVG